MYIQVISHNDENIYPWCCSLRFNQSTLLQEKLVWKDFNIEDDAGIALKPIIKRASNISVANIVLEIRFYWAGKGTMRIPDRGVYGPLISAVSMVSGELFKWMSLLCHFRDAVFLRTPLRTPLLDGPQINSHDFQQKCNHRNLLVKN